MRVHYIMICGKVVEKMANLHLSQKKNLREVHDQEALCCLQQWFFIKRSNLSYKY